MTEFGRELWGYLSAVPWRFGINRPRQIGSYIRYIGDADVARYSRRIERYVRRLCWIGGLRILKEQEVRHMPDDNAVRVGDAYGMVGSVGWKMDVL